MFHLHDSGQRPGRTESIARLPVDSDSHETGGEIAGMTAGCLFRDSEFFSNEYLKRRSHHGETREIGRF
jgi:hypothetical protein